MGKLWLGLLVFVSLSLSSSPIGQEVITVQKVDYKQQVRADFKTALRYVLLHEGFYANHPRDAGGETYAGITRNFNPSWSGWRLVDEYKKSHSLNNNDSIPIPLLQWKVNEYYVDIWVKEDFFSIKDQDVANYTLDFRINGTIGALVIKRTLVEMGYPLIANNSIDSTTITYLNKVHKWEFLCHLMNNRIDFYTRIVDKKHDQIIFLNTWVKRIKV